jgi:predicted dehydrogenase
MSPPVRYGVVGAGRVFQRLHLPSVLARPGWQVSVVCDPEPERVSAELVSAGLDLAGVLVTRDLTAFFGDGRPDVVAVCTPNDAHVVPVREAIHHGAAVLCEKPVAARLRDARALAALPRGDRPVGVNLPYRFHELLPLLRDDVVGGEFEASVRFTTLGLRVWRPTTQWYRDPVRAGGGALVDLGPHVLDTLTVLFGQPGAVTCRVDDATVEECAVATVRFDRGPATVVIDRGSRRLSFVIEVRHACGVTVLDLVHGTLRTALGEVLTAEQKQPELAAVTRFFALVDNAPGGELVGLAEAVAVEEVIGRLRARAEVDPRLREGLPA